MILGGKDNRTVVDPRTANQISTAAKQAAPNPKQVARRRRARLANELDQHVDTVSTVFRSSSSDGYQPAG